MTHPKASQFDAFLQDLVHGSKSKLSETLPGNGLAVTVRSIKDGSIIYSGSAGPEVTPSSSGWLASCTKLVTPLALLQLVEQGKLDLDVPVQDLLPEGFDVSHVLTGFAEDGTPQLEDANIPVTARMLCDHTSGLAYPTWTPSLMRYLKREPKRDDLLKQSKWACQGPLIHQPGESYTYGPGLGTAGALVEAITGQTFEDYLQQHIFKPLGLTKTSFYPPDDFNPSFPLRKPESGKPAGGFNPLAQSETEWIRADLGGVQPDWFRGDSGLFCNTIEYSIIMAAVGRDLLGENPKSQLFASPKTARLLLESRMSKAAKAALDANLHAGWATKPLLKDVQPGDFEFGLGYIVNHRQLATGRRLKAGAWSGITGTTGWVDKEAGIAVSTMMQVLYSSDLAVRIANDLVEEQIYKCFV